MTIIKIYLNIFSLLMNVLYDVIGKSFMIAKDLKEYQILLNNSN